MPPRFAIVRAATFAAAAVVGGVLAGAPGPAPLPRAAAQDMMSHVDLASPRMSRAEMTREQVAELVAAASGGAPDFSDKSLNGLDLSGLDLSRANLRWAVNRLGSLTPDRRPTLALAQFWCSWGESRKARAT